MDVVANVTKFPQKRLRSKVGWSEYTFSYDEKYVTVESSKGIDSGTRKYDLWRLIPTPATGTNIAARGGNPDANWCHVLLGDPDRNLLGVPLVSTS